MILQLRPSDSRSTVSDFSSTPQDLLPCALIWFDRNLIVRVASSDSAVLPPLSDFNYLVECLKRSPINAVRLDHNMNQSSLVWWIQACKKANKLCHIDLVTSVASLDAEVIENSRNLSATNLEKLTTSFRTLFNKVLASILLICLIPILGFGLFLNFIKGIDFSLIKYWVIGKDGHIFEVAEWVDVNLKQDENPSYLFSVIRNIPKLINVLRGEMNLFGLLPIQIDTVLKDTSNRTSLEPNLSLKPGVFFRVK